MARTEGDERGAVLSRARSHWAASGVPIRFSTAPGRVSAQTPHVIPFARAAPASSGRRTPSAHAVPAGSIARCPALAQAPDGLLAVDNAAVAT